MNDIHTYNDMNENVGLPGKDSVTFRYSGSRVSPAAVGKSFRAQ